MLTEERNRTPVAAAPARRGGRRRIVVLGGGTGGTLIANRLRRKLSEDDFEIHVVDRDDRHVYQPGLLFVPFGLAKPEHIVRPSAGGSCDAGSPSTRPRSSRSSSTTTGVQLDDGSALDYDVLVVATGAVLQPEETEGMTGPGWGERVATFYDVEGGN